MNDDQPGFILDSYALLAFLGGEPGKEVVRACLDKANRKELKLYLSLINLGEVLYITERVHKLTAAQSALALIEQLPIEVLPVTKETVLSAAHIKAHFPIAYADAFAAAAALDRGNPILTGDPEFQAIEHEVDIHWIRSMET